MSHLWTLNTEKFYDVRYHITWMMEVYMELGCSGWWNIIYEICLYTKHIYKINILSIIKFSVKAWARKKIEEISRLVDVYKMQLTVNLTIGSSRQRWHHKNVLWAVLSDLPKKRNLILGDRSWRRDSKR